MPLSEVAIPTPLTWDGPPKYLQTYWGRMAQIREHFHSAFWQAFHVALADYWNNALGFDVVGFDQKIVQSGDRQMAAVVTERWGQQAADLIQAILDSGGNAATGNTDA